jgi:hypothetical protein
VGQLPTPNVQRKDDMARTVKCAVTKEIGTSDTFIKIDGKYYKSQEVYDEDHKQKELWSEIIRYICEDLLKYQKGQVFPTLITKKLLELKYYDREVILETIKVKSNDILYQINQDGKFKDDTGKIFYIFAIIKNNINDIHKKWKYNQAQIRLSNNSNIEGNINNIGKENVQKGKDLTKWLEDDDI